VNNREELLKYQPHLGYNTLFGKKIKFEELNLDENLKNAFLDSLILSEGI
jgi:hypothetical protein